MMNNASVLTPQQLLVYLGEWNFCLWILRFLFSYDLTSAYEQRYRDYHTSNYVGSDNSQEANCGTGRLVQYAAYEADRPG